jgi:hypothetical protein
MTRLTNALGFAVATTILGLSTPALAAAVAAPTRTWVSGVGDDANPCSRTAPCKTFAGAIGQTAAGGEIDCLDAGGFGTLTITKAITLDCGGGTGGMPGGILSSGTTGIVINAAATDKVMIRNLAINGAGTGASGISFVNGASLTLQNVTISGVGAGGESAIDYLSPTNGGKLQMTKVDIRDVTGNGITIAPSNGTAINVLLDQVTVTNAAIGLQAQDGAVVNAVNSVFSNNSRGVSTVSVSGGYATINLDGVYVTGNVNFGIAAGNNTSVRMSNVGVYGNGGGLKVTGNGLIVSFTNNRLGPDAGTTGLPSLSVNEK